MNCRICKAPAVGICQWPALQFVPVPVGELRIGEVVQWWSPSKFGRVARLAAIQYLDPPDWALVTVQLYSSLKPRVVINTTSYTVRELHAQRNSVCGLAVCEAHAREGGFVTCQEHWDAWQKVS